MIILLVISSHSCPDHLASQNINKLGGLMSDKIQLYSLATPNGQKVAVALEEMGLDYDAHTINIMKGDQFTDDFKRINPNSKIPAILDGDHAVMESGAILVYLAEKTGKFLPKDSIDRSRVLQMG